jgi:dihydrodipicolinate synthase/N-acetylneuraminate lyase
LTDKGYAGLPLIIGCGLPSALATIKLTHEAKAAGGDYALVLPPSYWPGAMSKPVLVKFFEEVADQSPLPVLIYNFPVVANGINIDSDTMIQLSQHANIVGCKLTCGVRALRIPSVLAELG